MNAKNTEDSYMIPSANNRTSMNSRTSHMDKVLESNMDTIGVDNTRHRVRRCYLSDMHTRSINDVPRCNVKVITEELKKDEVYDDVT